ncbi:MAG: metal ABC transporter permease, partial [Chloroflexota bacterium]
MDPLAWLTEPYGSTFMQRAAIAALIVGAVVPTIGCWTLLRRLSYLGDAMSHGTLAGIAIGSLAGLSVTGGALAGGLVMSLVIVALLAHPRLREDTVVGIAESALFAIGLVVSGRWGCGGVVGGQLVVGGGSSGGGGDR